MHWGMVLHVFMCTKGLVLCFGRDLAIVTVGWKTCIGREEYVIDSFSGALLVLVGQVVELSGTRLWVISSSL